MRKDTYTLVVDSITESEEYYKKYFGWGAEQKSMSFLMMDTDSPLRFGLVEKRYLMENLGMKEEELPTNSFCTWLYDSKEELRLEEKELLKKGLLQIGDIGHFFKDQRGMIWELRVKGDVI